MSVASAAVMLVRGIGVIAFFTVVMPLGAKRMRFPRGFRERTGFFAFQDGDVDGTLLHSVSVHFFQNQIRVGRRHFLRHIRSGNSLIMNYDRNRNYLTWPTSNDIAGVNNAY
jgi:hypothetical protein